MDRGIITISKTGAVTVPTAPAWMTKFEIADLFGVFSCDIHKAVNVITDTIGLPDVLHCINFVQFIVLVNCPYRLVEMCIRDRVYARVSPKKLFEDMDKFIEATHDFKLTL